MNELCFKILELRGKGLGSKKIAKELGCSSATVSKYINMYDVGITKEDIKRKRSIQSIERKSRNKELTESKGGTLSSSHNKRMRELMRSLAIDLKGGECNICSYNKCKESLAFHHVDDKDKLFSLSGRNMISRSYELVLNEISKCVLLCHNCHMEVHYGLTKCPENIGFVFTPPKDPKDYVKNTQSL